MQSITTKFIPCTNTKPNRIKVMCETGSKTYSQPLADSIEEAHTICAIKYLKERNWVKHGDKVASGMNSDGSGYNYVIVSDTSITTIMI